jgi:hypothetical protein
LETELAVVEVLETIEEVVHTLEDPWVVLVDNYFGLVVGYYHLEYQKKMMVVAVWMIMVSTTMDKNRDMNPKKIE